MKSLAIVILAAGKGTRMKSDRPKVLHPLLGRPLLDYVLAVAGRLKPEKTVVVVGHEADQVSRTFARPELTFVRQVPQLGTGHAVRQAEAELSGFPGTILVLSGDIPLVAEDTLKRLLKMHRRSGAPVTLLSTFLEDPFGYGRILRDSRGGLLRIVEEKDASPEDRRVQEVNAGIYCFETPFLFEALAGLSRKNRQKEYYLTDLVEKAQRAGLPVQVFQHARSEEVLGINDRLELARSDRILRRRINEDWMRKGVTLQDPDSTLIESTVSIGPDTTIGPFTVLRGRTRIGKGCVIHSHTVLENARLADGASAGPLMEIKNRLIKKEP